MIRTFHFPPMTPTAAARSADSKDTSGTSDFVFIACRRNSHPLGRGPWRRSASSISVKSDLRRTSTVVDTWLLDDSLCSGTPR